MGDSSGRVTSAISSRVLQGDDRVIPVAGSRLRSRRGGVDAKTVGNLVDDARDGVLAVEVGKRSKDHCRLIGGSIRGRVAENLKVSWTRTGSVVHALICHNRGFLPVALAVGRLRVDTSRRRASTEALEKSRCIGAWDGLARVVGISAVERRVQARGLGRVGISDNVNIKYLCIDNLRSKKGDRKDAEGKDGAVHCIGLLGVGGWIGTDHRPRLLERKKCFWDASTGIFLMQRGRKMSCLIVF